MSKERCLSALFISSAVIAASIAVAPRARADGPDHLEDRLSAMMGRPGGLTSDEVAARAQATSFDLEAKRADVRAAAAAVDQVLAMNLPKLTLSANYTRLSEITPPNLGSLVASADPNQQPGPIAPGTQLISVPLTFPLYFNSWNFQASLNVPISDYVLRTAQSYAAATHSKRASEASERAEVLKVAADARLAYYNWVRAKLAIVVAEQASAQSRAHLDDVKHLLDAGAASPADVMRVESQLAQNDLLVARSKNLTAVLVDQIRTATHTPDLHIEEIGENLFNPAAPAANEDDLEAAYRSALDRRAEIKALTETEVSLKEQAKVVRAGYLPRLDGFADLSYANLNPRIFPENDQFTTTWSVGGQATWTINEIVTTNASARGLDAKTASVKAQKNALFDGVRSEIAQGQQSLKDAEAELETSARGLRAAEESYRVRRELFHNGRATSVELTDAETDLLRARLDAINARVDLRVAKVRFDHAVGADVH